MKLEVSVKGSEQVLKHLQNAANMKEITQFMRAQGAALQQEMMREAVFTKGYSTGATKRSIELEMRDNDFTAGVQPTTEYSPYVEYGTRFMSAQPFVRPALRTRRGTFISELRDILK